MGYLRGAVLAVALPVVAMSLVAVGTAAAAPSGLNQWSCQLSDLHPRPVVLVHGNGSGMTATWDTLARSLTADGYCVFALDYGRHLPGTTENLLDVAGGTDIETSSKVLAAFVERVRTATGARQVDIVGHSMGALTARQYLRFDGGTDSTGPANNAVHTLVTLGGTNQGTTFETNKQVRDDAAAIGAPADQAIAAAVGPAYAQQMVGSPFLTALNAGGDTRPGVEYVAIATRDARRPHHHACRIRFSDTGTGRSQRLGPGRLPRPRRRPHGSDHLTAGPLAHPDRPRSRPLGAPPGAMLMTTWGTR